MIDRDHNPLSLRRQCKLLGVNRSRLYYTAAAVSPEQLDLMNRIDEEFTAWPFTGVDRMTAVLQIGRASCRERVCHRV